MGKKAFARGLLISLLFGYISFVMIPLYVPRPPFVPGFAPPPDMWPRVVSLLGMVLGLLAMFFSIYGEVRSKGRVPDSPDEENFHWTRSGVIRFVLTLLVFGGFIALVPWLGFLAASIVLLFVCFLLAGAAQHWKKGLVLSLLLPLALYYFFSHVTHTPFPQGSWGVSSLLQ